jgi:heme A synthase
MLEYRLARATAAATFALLVIGGMVHATGSSLACPDWPLCYGQFFPAMEGGVLFEHGHRLVALAVSVLTVVLAVTVWRRQRETAVRVGSLVAVGLVLFQASLGALTVVWKLPLVVSSGHLATSMAFFSLLVWLSWRLAPPAPAGGEAPASGPVRALAGVAALVVYLQIVLGALVRHTGSGLACDTSVVLCEGAVWPLGGPAQLVTLHRLAGVAVALLVTAAAVAALRSGPSRARSAARLAPLVVVVQILLGAWTVWSLISVAVVSLHLAGAVLLLADSLLLFLLLGPQPSAQQAGRADVSRLVPAAG